MVEAIRCTCSTCLAKRAAREPIPPLLFDATSHKPLPNPWALQQELQTCVSCKHPSNRHEGGLYACRDCSCKVVMVRYTPDIWDEPTTGASSTARVYSAVEDGVGRCTCPEGWPHEFVMQAQRPRQPTTLSMRWAIPETRWVLCRHASPCLKDDEVFPDA